MVKARPAGIITVKFGLQGTVWQSGSPRDGAQAKSRLGVGAGGHIAAPSLSRVSYHKMHRSIMPRPASAPPASLGRRRRRLPPIACLVSFP